MPAGSFTRRVADRAGIRDEEARRAIDAVLETLAMRIAGGEVDDLRRRLPVELHRPLDRGKKLSGGRATPIKLAAFVRRVAEREGVPGPIALKHTAAVLGVLREAVGEQEFLDVTVQLPDDYAAVVGR
jgi:uncharacterized protein (DUF2267 family)